MGSSTKVAPDDGAAGGKKSNAALKIGIAACLVVGIGLGLGLGIGMDWDDDDDAGNGGSSFQATSLPLSTDHPPQLTQLPPPLPPASYRAGIL